MYKKLESHLQDMLCVVKSVILPSSSTIVDVISFDEINMQATGYK